MKKLGNQVVQCRLGEITERMFKTAATLKLRVRSHWADRRWAAMLLWPFKKSKREGAQNVTHTKTKRRAIHSETILSRSKKHRLLP
jgi:hypothetical protein